MPRSDISNFVIHFTKGDSKEAAFETLMKIIREETLLGSNTWIRGGFNCVCFSEAPLENLQDGLVNADYYSNYSPFGIMVDKKWLYEQGGRPVIYEPDEEYDMLPKSHRWRHMRYEPHREPPIDFLWEREWRIHCNSLHINPSVASIVVENTHWTERLAYEHERDQEWRVREYQLIFDEDFARNFYEPFMWNIFCLR